MKHILAILLLAGIAMPAIAAEKSNAKKKSGEAAKEKPPRKRRRRPSWLRSP